MHKTKIKSHGTKFIIAIQEIFNVIRNAIEIARIHLVQVDESTIKVEPITFFNRDWNSIWKIAIYKQLERPRVKNAIDPDIGTLADDPCTK